MKTSFSPLPHCVNLMDREVIGFTVVRLNRCDRYIRTQKPTCRQRFLRFNVCIANDA
ncbi:MAG: hypothetical protein R3C05_03265 [Pirellulaceae bacterium]